MKRISNFKEFVNESYVANAMKKVKDWATSFVKNIQDGLIRIIPSGPKAGKPVAVLFDGAKGSIADQLASFYEGTPYAEVVKKPKFLWNIPERMMY